MRVAMRPPVSRASGAVHLHSGSPTSVAAWLGALGKRNPDHEGGVFRRTFKGALSDLDVPPRRRLTVERPGSTLKGSSVQAPAVGEAPRTARGKAPGAKKRSK